MSLVTIADYERITGKTVASEDQARIQALLDAASAAVQGVTGQTIAKARTPAELQIIDHWRPTLVLDEVPVIEAADPDTLVVTDPDGNEVPRDHYTLLAKSGELKHCDCTPWAPGCYTVAYSHGYEPVPADLQTLIVGAVDSVVSVPAGVASQSVESYSVTYREGASAADLAGIGGAVLDRYTVRDPA